MWEDWKFYVLFTIEEVNQGSWVYNDHSNDKSFICGNNNKNKMLSHQRKKGYTQAFLELSENGKIKSTFKVLLKNSI